MHACNAQQHPSPKHHSNFSVSAFLEKDRHMLQEIEQMKADRQRILEDLLRESEQRAMNELSSDLKQVKDTSGKGMKSEQPQETAPSSLLKEKYPLAKSGKTPQNKGSKQEFDTLSGNKFV